MMKMSKINCAVGVVVLEALKEPKTLAQLSIDRVSHRRFWLQAPQMNDWKK
jgi:hypothetical protein